MNRSFASLFFAGFFIFSKRFPLVQRIDGDVQSLSVKRRPPLSYNIILLCPGQWQGRVDNYLRYKQEKNRSENKNEEEKDTAEEKRVRLSINQKGWKADARYVTE